ncbi:MAG: Rrf2 family transcriptional regulator, partial [Deltaproteobacteria bacterium]|nr:Rrf2 family transcriptional regulator [Deltaproteobacteria bacterium]
MLQITRDGEYAVRAVLFLATRPEGTLSLISDIAETQEVPRSYLSKIMQHLVRAGLVKS